MASSMVRDIFVTPLPAEDMDDEPQLKRTRLGSECSSGYATDSARSRFESGSSDNGHIDEDFIDTGDLFPLPPNDPLIGHEQLLPPTYPPTWPDIDSNANNDSTICEGQEPPLSPSQPLQDLDQEDVIEESYLESEPLEGKFLEHAKVSDFGEI